VRRHYGHSTPFGIAGQWRGTWSPFRESEGSVISGFNSRRKPAIASPPWAGALRMRQSQKKLGADLYIDSAATDAAAELQKLGGASVVLATAPSGKAMSSLLPGLTANGTLVVVGASEDPLEVSTALLILGRRNIKGWSAGTPSDSEDTLRFAEAAGVRPMIEKLPLEKAAEGYARMMSGDAPYRVVLTMG
jgi:D-arabinose 1-dehydrogenase-like Zn-dependent alcohol dehydrogenase